MICKYPSQIPIIDLMLMIIIPNYLKIVSIVQSNHNVKCIALLSDIWNLNIYLYHFQDRIEGIEVQAAQFVESGHFDSDNIQAKQTQLLNRYKALQVNRKMTSTNWVSKNEILTLIPNG